MSDKQLLTHSSMQCFKECRRKFYYQYELGLRRIDDARALRMGAAFHAGLEALTKSDGLDGACNVIRDAYAHCPEQFDIYEWQIECETILRLVLAYEWRWSNSPLEYVLTEGAFQIPLLNPATGQPAKHFDLAGKIDGIVRLEDGRLAVKESKTVSEDLALDSNYWRRLKRDSQISIYMIAARKMGYQVDTVLYDCTRKPSIAPTPVPLLDDDGIKIVLDAQGERVKNANGKSWRQTSDTEKGYKLQTRRMTVEEWGKRLTDDICSRPDFYYARCEIPRLDSDLITTESELWELQQAVRHAQREEHWFRTATKNTCPYCPFDSICNRTLEAEEVPLGFKKLTDPHPELLVEQLV